MKLFDKLKSKRQSKKQNKKVTDADRYEVMGGILGDKDKQTVKDSMFLYMLIGFTLLFIVGAIMLSVRFHAFGQYKKNNTTPLGTELKFQKTDASVKLDDVWTDKKRDVTMVHLKYDKGANRVLSSDGKNYKLYLVSEHGKPKVKMSYGVLGTRGDGYLFIKGHLDKQAYQIFIANKVDLDTGDDDENNGIEVNDKKDNADTRKSGDELTDDEIKNAVSDARTEDVDEDTGILNFGKSKHAKEPKADNINFRVNAFSDNTKVYNGSFLTKDGDIDYSKVMDKTSVQRIIKDYEDKLKKLKGKQKTLKASQHEYERRIKENKNDNDAKSELESAQDSYKDNEEEMDKIKGLIKRYKNTEFDKSSFGSMQEKSTVDEI